MWRCQRPSWRSSIHFGVFPAIPRVKKVFERFPVHLRVLGCVSPFFNPSGAWVESFRRFSFAVRAFFRHVGSMLYIPALVQSFALSSGHFSSRPPISALVRRYRSSSTHVGSRPPISALVGPFELIPGDAGVITSMRRLKNPADPRNVGVGSPSQSLVSDAAAFDARRSGSFNSLRHVLLPDDDRAAHSRPEREHTTDRPSAMRSCPFVTSRR
jgi:hypothetical protein